MLATIAMSEIVGFLTFMGEEEHEEQLFDVWLHSGMETGFEEFKKKMTKHSSDHKKVARSTVSEEEALAWADKYIKSV